MTRRTRTIMAMGAALIVATASALATPAAAKMPDYAQYVYERGDSHCTSEQGSSHHIACDAL